MNEDLLQRDAERPDVRSHAERGNEKDPPARRKILHALGFIVERMDLPLLGLVGTNLLGLTLLLAAFLPLGILMQRFGARIEGVVTFIGGLIVFGMDWIYRQKVDIVLESKQGGRMFYLPCWIWGVIWMMVGIIKTVWELTKG